MAGPAPAEPGQAPESQPRRVVVWGHDHVPLDRGVIGPSDLATDTRHGRLLLRSLMRAQLGLSLLCLAVALAVTASFPIIAATVPEIIRAKVMGIPLTLVVLGAGVFPVFLVIGWFYHRQASQLEARFIDLVDPPDRGRLDAEH
jgi:putative solute:sodium symporter small subunit